MRYWSKIADLNLFHLYFGAPLGVTPSEFRRDLWRKKNRVPVLSYDVVCVILHLVVLVQCRLVTDGQTDTTTANRARVASLGKSRVAERCADCGLW